MLIAGIWIGVFRGAAWPPVKLVHIKLTFPYLFESSAFDRWQKRLSSQFSECIVMQATSFLSPALFKPLYLKGLLVGYVLKSYREEIMESTEDQLHV